MIFFTFSVQTHFRTEAVLKCLWVATILRLLLGSALGVLSFLSSACPWTVLLLPMAFSIPDTNTHPLLSQLICLQFNPISITSCDTAVCI